MFTDIEKQDIESWRNILKPGKFECSWLQKFKNRILVSKLNKPEKKKCFCSQTDRTAYKKEFYIYYDLFNAPL